MKKKVEAKITANDTGLNIDGVSGRLYPLIDRLRRHSEWKYPNRIWSIDTYYSIAFTWMGKENELEERVLKQEEDMRMAGVL